jgi:hypothetical protein
MSSVNLQEFSIPASACLEAMARNRVDHVVTVPDWVQLHLDKMKLGAVSLGSTGNTYRDFTDSLKNKLQILTKDLRRAVVTHSSQFDKNFSRSRSVNLQFL